MKCEVCGHEQCRDKTHGRGDLRRIAEALESIAASLAPQPVLSDPDASANAIAALEHVENGGAPAAFPPLWTKAVTAEQPILSFTAPPGWSYATPGKCACARPDSTHEQWCYFAMRTT